jgi:hypothetical protein
MHAWILIKTGRGREYRNQGEKIVLLLAARMNHSTATGVGYQLWIRPGPYNGPFHKQLA